MENRYKFKSILLFVEGCIVSMIILFWYFCYDKNSIISTYLAGSNIIIYIYGGLLFIILHVLLFAFSPQISKIGWKSIELPKKIQGLSGSAFFLFGTGLFLMWKMKDQFSEVGVEDGLYYALPRTFEIVGLIVYFFYLGLLIKKGQDIDASILYFMYAFSILITFYGLVTLNPFLRGGGKNELFSAGIENYTSVTETIFNVLDGTPFSATTTGLYGHYSLFFYLPLKLFGDGMRQVAICLAVVGCVEQILFIYIINGIVPQRWLRLVFCYAGIIRPTFVYYAIFPIRTVWPMIVCAFLYRSSVKKMCILRPIMTKSVAFFLCGLSVLWNTETGLCCLVGVIVYFIWSYFYQEADQEHQKPLKFIIEMILGFMYSIFFPIMIVNVYNSICTKQVGGGFIIKSFFYPYITGGDWAFNTLSCQVSFGNHFWIFIFMTLLGMFGWTLIDIYIYKHNFQSPIIAAVSAIGIGVFGYYFNEAHWGCLSIVTKLWMVVCAFIVSNTLYIFSGAHNSIIAQIKRGIVIVIVAINAVLFYEGVLTDSIRISARNLSDSYDDSEVKKEIEIIRSSIPENTYGVGQGIQYIYHELNWDNHASYRDTSSIRIAITDDEYNAFIQDIRENNEILIGNDYEYDGPIREQVLDDEYVLTKTFIVGDYGYDYYCRKE